MFPLITSRLRADDIYGGCPSGTAARPHAVVVTVTSRIYQVLPKTLIHEPFDIFINGPAAAKKSCDRSIAKCLTFDRTEDKDMLEFVVGSIQSLKHCRQNRFPRKEAYWIHIGINYQ